MSNSVSLDSLTPEQRRQIHECLRLQPIDLKAEKISKIRPSTHEPDLKAPIDVFTVETIGDDTQIKLPYRFASALFNKVVNQDIEYAPLLNEHGKLPVSSIELRSIQMEPFEQAKEHLRLYGTTTLCLPTGFGKTMLSIMLAVHLGLSTVILIQNTTLMDQWYTSICTVAPDLKNMIWIVGTPPPEVASIVICMNKRVKSLPYEYRKTFGLLIIDEAHLHCTAGGVEPMLLFSPKNVIALSATLVRNDGMEMIIRAICGGHQVTVSMIKPYTMVRFNTKIKFTTSSGKRGLDYKKLSDEIIRHEMRNLMIVQLVLGNLHRKFIIMTRRVEHVNHIADLFREYGIDCDTLAGTKKSYRDTSVSILGVNKAGVGFDEKMKALDFSGRLSDTLILAMSIAGDSSPEESGLFNQVVGRLRADNPWVIYMVDSVPVIQKHFRDKKKLIEDGGGTIVEIDLNMHVAGCGVKLP